ncbi:Uncharacterised protein [Vibrio cholerae]|nr:Uncharacterised protein [Vibrio cholerae]CSB24964.1 Uncharacterised protein [Vibrio cholerae]CSB79561.1 Uncharacterised protein [Vibrio cholerae]CSD76780.1 Uncharacterised protein [Vibrio cholerae]
MWRRDGRNDFLENFIHAHTGFRRATHSINRIDTDDVFNLFRHTLRLCRRQVNLVQNGHDFQIHFDRGIAVC